MDEALFSGALSIAQLMLSESAVAEGGVLTPQAIADKVDEVLAMPTFKGVDRERLISALEHRFTIFTAPHRTLSADENHVVWLPAKKGEIDWRYWNRYKLYLDKQQMPQSAIDGIDSVSEDVLGRLEDPDRSGPWDRRGLVVGDVQSGKTANYSGLVCKAADAGYKVIIVLAGIHNSLRSQTQIRLDDSFLGFTSDVKPGERQQIFTPTGVGLLDSQIRANTGTNRAEKGDFNKTVANQFGINPGGLPLLFVIKKNVGVLKNVLGWITSSADGADQEGRKFVRNVPVLVVDDEADLASVDTKAQSFDEDGNPDPDHDPARTNEFIRRILRAFEKVAYVGYTATPFANIYIHDKGWTKELGEDLFPHSFIVNLPAATNYMGPSRVFGISQDEDAGLEEVEPLPLIRTVNDYAASDAVDEQQGWMPPKLVNKTGHIPLFDGKPTVPPSLRTAILSFLLSTTVRTIRRDDGPKHNSMLVHVVRYTRVQGLVGQQVSEELKAIVQRLQHGDGSRTPNILEEFEELWQRDFVPTNKECARITSPAEAPPLPDWNDVAANLAKVTSTVAVRLINGSAKDALEYDAAKQTGINVIAIGGDKLSRGLTLEGLTVSYFLRASRMYDTLMQMGRWFGYRDGYLDLCRLFTTAEIVMWFAHIAAANEELQSEFEHMVNVGGTPRDYGLKIRSHPVLLVTSRVKMRNGTQLQLSYSGDISETITFSRDPKWIARNFTATENWLTLLQKTSTPVGAKRGGYRWSGVPVSSVLQFLASYTSHEDASRADTSLLRKYISAQVNQGELETWTVLLTSSGDGDARPRKIVGLDCGLIKRSPFPESQQSGRYTIKRLVSPRDELVDLSSEQLSTALHLTVANWEKDPNPRKRPDVPTTAGRREAREVRPKSSGLIILYPLDPVIAKIENVPPIVGVAVSFPKSDTAREITYIVDNVFLRRGGDDESL